MKKNIMFRYALAIMFFMIAKSIYADNLKLGSLLTDNMVLQQNAEAKLWGMTMPEGNVTITVSWQKQKVTVKADKQGKWVAKVQTPAASYDTQKIIIASGKETQTLKDVLIGEVWLASGQSNMEMPLEGFGGCCTNHGTRDAVMAAQVSPYVRMFNVKKAQSMTEQQFCSGTWNKTEFPATMKFSATAYYFASMISNALNVPVGIVNASYGGAHLESWSPKTLCEQWDDIPTDSVSVYNFGTYDFDRPLLMYNAMFCPVKDYTYKGIIWYQGCSNIGHADVYPQRLKQMVEWWRKDIGCGDIPFYQVEISPYEYGDGSMPFSKIENQGEGGNKGGLGALIREAQMKATEIIPNCSLASTIDNVMPYERWNIHPGNKSVVGDRLAFIALNKTYGMKDISCEGPKPKKDSFRIIACEELPAEQKELSDSGKVAVIGFATDNKGICRSFDLSGFEIAGADKKFYPAKGMFRWQTNEVFLSSPEVPEPVAIRYCFRDWQPGSLLGGNELPCSPFRTDNW
ncbi:MAG: sialate O-acetylesterase [Prevotella sp.]|nr:sialate O-acetylesterase [Prevotella sp.]